MAYAHSVASVLKRRIVENLYAQVSELLGTYNSHTFLLDCVRWPKLISLIIQEHCYSISAKAKSLSLKCSAEKMLVS